MVLPDTFRSFVKTFKLGYEMINFSKVLLNGRLDFFVALKMFDKHLISGEEYTATIDRIFDLPELLYEYNQYTKQSDNWHLLGFMKIGFLFHGDVLLLGMQESNKGEIWRYGNGLLNTVYNKLDDNIFEFMSRLEEEIDENQLEYLGINTNQLYKNWGEDFWRVRE